MRMGCSCSDYIILMAFIGTSRSCSDLHYSSGMLATSYAYSDYIIPVAFMGTSCSCSDVRLSSGIYAKEL